ncbi:copper resistance protein CopC [Chryseomicrobium sp. FSL W7-1435]|uniref:copper resistance CopC family protein n=1 Tax=Chryseomicrobium sp. FSL W7-1435 TaxID=2921704 RepID=UPI00315B017A
MKRSLILITILMSLFITSVASAHTELSATTPEDGAELTETIDAITLTYSGQIEEGSVFDVLTESGQEVAVTDFTIEDGVLTGQLEQPLENGTYTVNWNSISEDGHPLNGTFGFTVNAPVEEVAAEEEVATEEEEEPVAGEQEEMDDSSQATEVASTTATAEEEGTSPFIWIIAALAVVLVAVSILTITRRKRA